MPVEGRYGVFELPSWFRLAVGVLLMLIGGASLTAAFTGYIGPEFRGLTRLSFGAIAFGFALFVVGGKTDSERNGYNF